MPLIRERSRDETYVWKFSVMYVLRWSIRDEMGSGRLRDFELERLIECVYRYQCSIILFCNVLSMRVILFLSFRNIGIYYRIRLVCTLTSPLLGISSKHHNGLVYYSL